MSIQPTFDLFAPPPPPPIPEGECPACGKHLRGYFDFNTNHGLLRQHHRAGAEFECMAMYLTLNHVLYRYRSIANPDTERHVSGTSCPACRRKRTTTREHVQQYELDNFAHYWSRVHEVWPECLYSSLDTLLAAVARHHGVADLIAGDEVPGWR